MKKGNSLRRLLASLLTLVLVTGLVGMDVMAATPEGGAAVSVVTEVSEDTLNETGSATEQSEEEALAEEEEETISGLEESAEASSDELSDDFTEEMTEELTEEPITSRIDQADDETKDKDKTNLLGEVDETELLTEKPDEGIYYSVEQNGEIFYAPVKVELTDSYEYTGNVITPVYTVTGPDDHILSPETDYTYSCDPSVIMEAGTYEITLTGKGDYEGSFTSKIIVRSAAWIRVTTDISSFDSGKTYYVDENVNIHHRIPVYRDVKLYLCRDKKLSVSGLTVNEGNSLTIDGEGYLESSRVSDEAAAIGSEKNQSCGTITINGGNIIAKVNGYDSAAIGGGTNGESGIITINGGHIEASSTQYGAAIGGGKGKPAGTIEINGGTVIATGGINAPGIGCGGGTTNGYPVSGGSIIINGGDVYATGGRDAAGIGGGRAYSDGYSGNVEIVKINGGKVTARSESGYGIGPGLDQKKPGERRTVEISWTDEDDYIDATSIVAETYTLNKSFCYTDQDGNVCGIVTADNIPDKDTSYIIRPVAGDRLKNLMFAQIESPDRYVMYTGKEINITPIVKGAEGETLTPDTDYTVSFNPEIVKDKGDYTLTVNGTGDYCGSKSIEFTVCDELKVTSDLYRWDNDFVYGVSGDVTIDQRITVQGDVILMLNEGARLTASEGIDVSGENKLTIKGTGELIATGSGFDAAIGSTGAGGSAGTIKIEGGKITATADETAAGIGGTQASNPPGTVTVTLGWTDRDDYIATSSIRADTYVFDKMFHYSVKTEDTVEDKGMATSYNIAGKDPSYILTPYEDSITKGQGTQNDPYIIEDATGWMDFATRVAYDTGADSFYMLSDNFDNSDSPVTEPVGTDEYPFKGSLDGNGRTLHVNINNKDITGAVFGTIEGAEITDLTVRGKVFAKRRSAGLVCKVSGDEISTIDNCVIDTEIKILSTESENSDMGGVIGYVRASNISVKNTVFAGHMENRGDYAGGLIGLCENTTVNLENCAFLGSVSEETAFEFHPIAICKNAEDITATVSRVYYTIAPGPGITDESIVASGIEVKAEPVKGKLYKKSTLQGYNFFEELSVSGPSSEYYHSGEIIKVEYSVTDPNGEELTEGIDYTATFDYEVKDVGDYRLTLAGRGDYVGEQIFDFSVILGGSFEYHESGEDGDKFTYVLTEYEYIYTGNQIKPEPAIKWNDIILRNGRDYTLSYKNNVNAAKKTDKKAPTITVKGKGQYKGSFTITFDIEERPINSGDIFAADISASIEDKQKTGKVIKSKPVIKYTNDAGKVVTLKENKDYKLTYAPEAPKEGEVTVTVTGIKNFKGSSSLKYRIITKGVDYSKAVIAPIADQPYKGDAYTADEIKALVRIKASKEKDAEDITETLKDKYTVSLSPSNPVNTGKVTVSVHGIEEYGELWKTVTFKIVPKPAKNGEGEPQVTVALADDAATGYTGKALKPAVTVKDNATNAIIPATNYTLKYSNNTNAAAEDAVKTVKGKEVSAAPAVTVTFKSNYSGSINKTFAITAVDLSDAGNKKSLSVSQADIRDNNKTIDDKALKPVVKYGKTTLKKDKDYKIGFTRDTTKEIQTATVDFCGNYTGSTTYSFRIYKADSILNLSDTDSEAFAVKTETTKCVYDGTKKTPKLTVTAMIDGIGITLIEGRDYSVSYSNNVNAADENAKKKPTWKITGKGAYKGSVSGTFVISPSILSTDNFDITVADAKYNKGKVLKPKVTVTEKTTGKVLKAGTDYTAEYKNNKALAEKTSENAPAVIITAKGNYTNADVADTDKTAVFRIYEKDMSTVVVDGIKTETYQGKAIEPEIRVYTDKSKKTEVSSDKYVVKYGENTNIGTGTVIITAKDETVYGGSKTVKFKIVPKAFKWLAE